jgi:hypothetical protein
VAATPPPLPHAARTATSHAPPPPRQTQTWTRIDSALRGGGRGYCGSHWRAGGGDGYLLPLQARRPLRSQLRKGFWAALQLKHSVTPYFNAKLNDHSMCAQNLSLHTYHTENRYRITNVTIYM